MLTQTEIVQVLQRVKNAFKSLLLTRLQRTYNITEQHRAMLVNVFSIAVLFFILVFSFLTEDLTWRLIVQLVVFALTAANLVWTRLGGSVHIAGRNLVVVMGVLAAYLIVSGGEENTGPLWTLAYPPLVFFLQGYRAGSFIVVSVAVLFGIILYSPGNLFTLTEYSDAFKIRYLAAFLLCASVGFIYEYSRSRAQKELVETATKLDRYARTDPLTDLANRRDMLDNLARENYRFERSGRIYSVLVCDIDHFKMINDRWGHRCGDTILVQIGKLLSSNLKRQDYVARWGGEEFLVLLTDTDESDAGKVAERIRRSIEETPFNCDGTGELSITMSVGYASCDRGLSVDQLIHRADVGLYAAKHAGRNRVGSPLGVG